MFVIRDQPDDGGRGADSERFVSRNRNSMVGRFFGLKDDVASRLRYFRVSPLPAQDVGKVASA